MNFLQPGIYRTQNGHEVRIDAINPNHHAVNGFVKDVGIVAYDFDGSVAYDHIPQELRILLETWQPFAKREGAPS